jgi:hypothetical protein
VYFGERRTYEAAHARGSFDLARCAYPFLVSVDAMEQSTAEPALRESVNRGDFHQSVVVPKYGSQAVVD